MRFIVFILFSALLARAQDCKIAYARDSKFFGSIVTIDLKIEGSNIAFVDGVGNRGEGEFILDKSKFPVTVSVKDRHNDYRDTLKLEYNENGYELDFGFIMPGDLFVVEKGGLVKSLVWKEYRFEREKYSVNFPDVFTTDSIKTPTKIGILNSQTKTCKLKKRKRLVYQVAYTDYEGITDSSSLSMQGAVSGMVASVNGKILVQKSFMYNGLSNHEVLIKTDKLYIRARLIRKENKLYILQVISKRKKLDDDFKKPFFDSFKVI